MPALVIAWGGVAAQSGGLPREDASALGRARATLDAHWEKSAAEERFCVRFPESPTGLESGDRLIVTSSYLDWSPLLVRVERGAGSGRIVVISSRGIMEIPLAESVVDGLLREFIYLSRAQVRDSNGELYERSSGWTSHVPYALAVLRRGSSAGPEEVLAGPAQADSHPWPRLAFDLDPKKFALEWLLGRVGELSRDVGRPITPGPEVRQEWLARLRGTKSLANALDQDASLAEANLLSVLSARLVVTWEMREALPELLRLGLEQEAYWLDVKTSADPTELILGKIDQYPGELLDYMRDHPGKVSEGLRRSVIIRALQSARRPTSLSILVEDLLEIGPGREELEKIRASAPGTPSSQQVHFLGLLSVATREPSCFEGLMEIARTPSEDRERPHIAAVDYLVRSISGDTARSARVKSLLRDLLETGGSDSWDCEKLALAFCTLCDRADIEVLLAAARSWPLCDRAYQVICLLDPGAALEAAKELVRIRLAPEFDGNHAHAIGALAIFVVLDQDDVLPFVEELAANPWMKSYEDDFASLRRQLTETDPDRRAAAAMENLGWVSSQLHAVLEANLRARGASDEALRPLLEPEPRSRAWPYGKHFEGSGE